MGEIKLYLDFDGVILDTIPVIYKELEENGFSLKTTPQKQISEFFSTLNWQEIIETTPQINNAIEEIKRIIENELYYPIILTHVNSRQEAEAKINFLNRHIPKINVIPTPKSIAKSDYVYPYNAVLVDDYKVNLKTWQEKDGIPIHFDHKFDFDKDNSPYPVITSLDALIYLYDYIKSIQSINYARKKKRW